MVLKTCIHCMPNFLIKLAQSVHSVILKSKSLEQGMEPVRFKVVITDNFPELMRSRSICWYVRRWRSMIMSGSVIMWSVFRDVWIDIILIRGGMVEVARRTGRSLMRSRLNRWTVCTGALWGVLAGRMQFSNRIAQIGNRFGNLMKRIINLAEK